MKTVTLGNTGLTIIFDPLKKSGYIESSLERDPKSNEYNAAMDALESLILAHACVGINIESEEYLTGLETALTAIDNNIE